MFFLHFKSSLKDKKSKSTPEIKGVKRYFFPAEQMQRYQKVFDLNTPVLNGSEG